MHSGNGLRCLLQRLWLWHTLGLFLAAADTTPPVLHIEDAQPFIFHVLMTVRLNEDGTIYCGALETLSSYTPSIAQKLGDVNLVVGILTPATLYDVFCYAEDLFVNGLTLAQVAGTKTSLATASGGDYTAPTFSYISPNYQVESIAMTLYFQLSEDGTVWCVAKVDTGSGTTRPLASDFLLDQNVDAWGTQTVSAALSYQASITLTGLTEDTDYDVYCFAEDWGWPNEPYCRGSCQAGHSHPNHSGTNHSDAALDGEDVPLEMGILTQLISLIQDPFATTPTRAGSHRAAQSSQLTEDRGVRKIKDLRGTWDLWPCVQKRRAQAASFLAAKPGASPAPESSGDRVIRVPAGYGDGDGDGLPGQGYQGNMAGHGMAGFDQGYGYGMDESYSQPGMVNQGNYGIQGLANGTFGGASAAGAGAVGAAGGAAGAAGAGTKTVKMPAPGCNPGSCPDPPEPGMVCEPCGEVSRHMGPGPYSQYGQQAAMRRGILQRYAEIAAAGPAAFGLGAAAGADGLGSGAPSAEEASSPTLRCGLRWSIVEEFGRVPGPLTGEAKSPPCSGEDYVDYKSLKQRIKNGCTQSDFQENYGLELSKVSSRLSEGSVLSRDPHYAVMNRQALDKISKKFDKQLKGRVRAANWVTTTSELAKSLGGLQAGNAPNLKAARAILRDGGLRAFWQGNGANVLKVMPESAVKFLVYDKVKDRRLLAGSVAGCVSQLVVYPLDVIKTRLAAAPAGAYNGIFDCIQVTVWKEGIQALYKGLWPALLAIIPASGIDLAVYHTLKVHYTERFRKEETSNMPLALSLCFGAASATCGALVAYPLTVVRTRLIDCFWKILDAHGPTGFYRGLIPALCKTIPAMSIGWAAFEFAKSLAEAVL
eukprot:g12411.t1